MYRRSSTSVIRVCPGLGQASQETAMGYGHQRNRSDSRRKWQLTSTVNQVQPLPDTMRPKTRPVGHEKDATCIATHQRPILCPVRAFERRHERFALNSGLGSRCLVLIYQVDDLENGPASSSHAASARIGRQTATADCGRPGDLARTRMTKIKRSLRQFRHSRRHYAVVWWSKDQKGRH